MTARQRQPAFGRKVRQWRESGLAPSTDIFLSLGWAYGRAWQWRIVIPDDVDPAELDYSCVAGLSCLMFGNSSPRMDDVARAVIPYGPYRLIGVCLRPPSSVIPIL